MSKVYRHIRLDKNEPFYIGISSDDERPYDKQGRNNIWYKITSKTDYEVEIMLDDLTWEDACEKEKEFIKLYGRIDKGTGTLANLTDGGEGGFGIIFTEERRETIRQKQIGENNSFFGKKHKESSKQKMSESLKTYYETNESHMKGKKASVETKEKMSETRKGKKINQPKMKCIYCGLVSVPININRWHNDNCKDKNK